MFFNLRIAYMYEKGQHGRGVLIGDIYIERTGNTARVIKFPLVLQGTKEAVSMGLNVYDMIEPIPSHFADSVFVETELEERLRSKLEDCNVSYYH